MRVMNEAVVANGVRLRLRRRERQRDAVRRGAKGEKRRSERPSRPLRARPQIRHPRIRRHRAVPRQGPLMELERLPRKHGLVRRGRGRTRREGRMTGKAVVARELIVQVVLGREVERRIRRRRRIRLRRGEEERKKAARRQEEVAGIIAVRF